MDLKAKFEEKKRKLQEMKEKGRVKTEQQKADRKRRKKNKIKNMKPGARQAIASGLMTRSGPVNVMKDEYRRRKYEREQKYNRKGKDSSK